MPGFSITVNVTQHDGYVKLLKHEVKFTEHKLFHNIIHSLNMLSPKPKISHRIVTEMSKCVQYVVSECFGGLQRRTCES